MSGAEVETLRGRFSREIATLFPGYFALVMATGIISIASQLLGFSAPAQLLLVANLAFYATLLVLTVARAARYPRRLFADLADHARGPGYFTLVAATNVLGSQFLRVAGWRSAAELCLAAGLGLWVLVTYAFFLAVIVRVGKPQLGQGINGAWLLATVSTQSVAILGASLVEPFGWPAPLVLFGALVFFLIGCMLYLTIITLIFYRFTFLELETATLTPPYWISMGAVAITALAGSTMLLVADRSPLVTELASFLRGFTLFFWAAGTWWIPLLMLLGAWRHLWRRHALTYDPQYWAMVFPLGMYAAATWQLATALPLAPLASLARIALPVAWLAWIVAAAGMVHSLWHWSRGDR